MATSMATVGVRGTGNAGFLVGPNGMTLYVFAKDAKGVSNCAADCIDDWPALTVPAGSMPTGVDAARGALAVFKRSDDGTMQVGGVDCKKLKNQNQKFYRAVSLTLDEP